MSLSKGFVVGIFLISLIVSTLCCWGSSILPESTANENPSSSESNPTDLPTATSVPEASTSVPPTTTPIPPTMTPVPTSQSTSTPESSATVRRFNDFVFELDSCSKSGELVTCEFTITNEGADRELMLDAYASSLYDDRGNEYRGDRVWIANVKSGAGGFADHTLISQVSVDGKMTFSGVSSEATKIALLRIHCFSDSSYDPEFRDIPFNN